MEPRMNIRNLVLSGNIDEAMNQLNTIDQNVWISKRLKKSKKLSKLMNFFVYLSLKILQSNEDLKFNVKLQKCIEYIRSNKIDEAILFAKEELVPLIEQNVKYKYSKK